MTNKNQFLKRQFGFWVYLRRWLSALAFGFGLMLLSAKAFAGSVTVTLQLPPGSYTLPSNMEVWARAIAIDGNPGDMSQRLLTFDEMEDGPGSQVSAVLPLDNTLNYVVQYECTDFNFPVPCTKVVPTLWYQSSSDIDLVLRQDDAQVLAGAADHGEIVLPIQSGNAITGTLALPAGVMASEEIRGRVAARNVASPSLFPTWPFTIPMGSNSTSYEIRVLDDATESWNVGYVCVASPPDAGCEEFISQGYYQSSSPINTVEDTVDAEAIVGGRNTSGINFQLLNGYTISGSLIVPTPVVDAAGLEATVRAQDRTDTTNTSSTIVIIPQGQTSADYAFSVSLSETAEWVLNYTCQDMVTPIECGEYLRRGFYNDGVMVENGNQVTTPLPGGVSYTDIDLTLLTGPTLSGMLVLSEGVAPEGGLEFIVRAFETSGSAGDFQDAITMPAGESQVEFAVNVGSDVGYTYRLSYNCSEALTIACENVVDEGFYNATTMETVYTMEEAVDIANGGADLAGLVLVVDSMLAVEEELCVPIVTANQSVAMVCL